jgi:hypothetical protein
MLRIGFMLETDGWTWAMVVDDEEVYRSVDRFGSEADARWDARRRLAGALTTATTPVPLPDEDESPAERWSFHGPDVIWPGRAWSRSWSLSSSRSCWTGYCPSGCIWLDGFLRMTING